MITLREVSDQQARSTPLEPLCNSAFPQACADISSAALPSQGGPSRAQQRTMSGSQRLERILVQLEARSRGLVPFDHHSHLPITRVPFAKVLIAGFLIAIWLVSLACAVLIFLPGHHSSESFGQRLVKSAPLIPSKQSKTPAGPTPREGMSAPSPLIFGSPQPVVRGEKPGVSDSTSLKSSSPVGSYQHHDVVSSHHRIAKVATSKTATSITLLVVPLARWADTRKTKVARGVSDGETVPTSSASPVQAADNLRDRKPSASAVAHKGADGIIDYWMLPHGPFFSEPARVVPIGTSPQGMFVHNLDDGKNYRLTPTGDWYALIVTQTPEKP